MYGLINDSLKNYVVNRKGSVFWKDLMHRHGLEVLDFSPMKQVKDAVTYDLVAIICEELDVDSHTLLVDFGRHWILNTTKDSFSLIMRASGDSLIEFLGNVNDLHSKISSTFLNYRPPQFTLQQIESNQYILQYSSHRPGLTDFVEGLLIGLAENFETDIVIDRIQKDSLEGGDSSSFCFRIIDTISD